MTVTTRAVVQWNPTDPFTLETVTLDEPRPDEVRVRVHAAGLCHTDHALVAGGYSEIRRPVVPGHEGAGVVEAVGTNVTDLAVGDHVLLLIPVPACGVCGACVKGLTYFCEDGRYTGPGMQISDHTSRHHARGQDLSVFVFLGTFAERTVVNQLSCLKIDSSIPFDVACSIGCAGVTGWGSVQNTGRIQPGDSVVVVGVGGVGANALMAARFLGAKDLIAVDPLESKRSHALTFGADAAVATLKEARDLVRERTDGRMADLIVMAMGVGDSSLLQSALNVLGNRGRCVVVNVHPEAEREARLSLRSLQASEKQILGCLSGSWHGREGAGFLLDLLRRGLYDPSLLVSRTYGLDAVEQGYADQLAGECIRAILVMPDPVD